MRSCKVYKRGTRDAELCENDLKRVQLMSDLLDLFETPSATIFSIALKESTGRFDRPST